MPAEGRSMTLFSKRQAQDPGGKPVPETSISYLDQGSKISGQLFFARPALIAGQIDGEIDGTEVTIAESAVLSARVRAESVVVCGEVKGDITASVRIELRSAAKVIGNLTAPTLVVEEGATLEGECAVSPPFVQEERTAIPRRKDAPMRSAIQA
jgi:cytoskeletal protein CcmA (bactofilin family)